MYVVAHAAQGGKTRIRYYNLTNGLNMEMADIPEFARKTAFVGGMNHWLLKYLQQPTSVEPSFVTGLAMRTRHFEA
jgi:hypothetical protein